MSAATEPVPAGTWVEIQQVILTTEQRAPGIPADTAATPLILRVNGFLTQPAAVGETATVTTIIGRTLTGTLSVVTPSYDHGFGRTVPELLTIGTGYES